MNISNGFTYIKSPLLKALFLAALLMVACREKPTPPANMVSEDKMAKVLTDLYVAEARIMEKNLSKKKSKEAFLEEEQAIFEKYEVDSSTYSKTYTYLAEHDFLTFQDVYNVVLDTLKARKERHNVAK